jgi:hypothetical protein
VIGYYAHHHGRGHIQRALCIADHVTGPMTILTSADVDAQDRSAGPACWVDLERDDRERPRGDPTAGGVLHWAPPDDPGLRRRMAGIATWIDQSAPAVMVVDVSVEVTALSRLMGVPVVVVAMPGDRTDRAHRLGYDLAEALLACWPTTMSAPGWPRSWTDKTCFASAFSRYDTRIETGDVAPRAAGRRRVALLLGAGGTDIGGPQVATAIAATPGWEWDVLGGPDPQQWRADPWPALRAADVVVTHAGQNALAEVAAARTPAVVIPQDRPHGEQHATAAALDHAGLAVVRHHWPPPSEWSALLNEAGTRDGRGWASWCPGDGAVRAARFIHAVARGERSSSPCASR